jgi:hypothetical protein
MHRVVVWESHHLPNLASLQQPWQHFSMIEPTEQIILTSKNFHTTIVDSYSTNRIGKIVGDLGHWNGGDTLKDKNVIGMYAYEQVVFFQPILAWRGFGLQSF